MLEFCDKNNIVFNNSWITLNSWNTLLSVAKDAYLNNHSKSTHYAQNYRKRQKLWGWKVLWFAGLIRYVEKSFVIFSITTLIHGFPALQNSYKHFNESFAFLTWIFLNTILNIMDESTLLTHVCSDFTLSRMTMQSQEKSYSWSESEMKQITNRSLVSFFWKLLPNLLAETF